MLPIDTMLPIDVTARVLRTLGWKELARLDAAASRRCPAGTSMLCRGLRWELESRLSAIEKYVEQLTESLERVRAAPGGDSLSDTDLYDSTLEGVSKDRAYHSEFHYEISNFIRCLPEATPEFLVKIVGTLREIEQYRHWDYYIFELLWGVKNPPYDVRGAFFQAFVSTANDDLAELLLLAAGGGLGDPDEFQAPWSPRQPPFIHPRRRETYFSLRYQASRERLLDVFRDHLQVLFYSSRPYGWSKEFMRRAKELCLRILSGLDVSTLSEEIDRRNRNLIDRPISNGEKDALSDIGKLFRALAGMSAGAEKQRCRELRLPALP